MVISLVFRFPSKVIIHSLNVEKYQIKREGGDVLVCKCDFSGVCCTLPPPSPCRFPVPVSLSPFRYLTGREFSRGGVEAALFELLLFTQKSQLAVRNRHLFLSLASRASVEAHPSVLRSQLSHVHSCVAPWAVICVKPTRTARDVRAWFWFRWGSSDTCLQCPLPPEEDPLCPSNT